MSIKKFFKDLLFETEEERSSAELVALYEKTRECKSLYDDVERLKKKIESLENTIRCIEHKCGYFVGKTEEGSKSNNIYADRIGFYDNEYIFYLNNAIVGILSSDVYKEVVFVDSEKEK